MPPQRAPRETVAGVEPWTYLMGLTPHKVHAYEDFARGGKVYLKWLVVKPNPRAQVKRTGKPVRDWTRRSLGYGVRDAKGKLQRDLVARAMAAVEEQYRRLLAGETPATTPTAPTRELTILDGWALAIDPERGKWNHETPHRKEMARAIKRASAILGRGCLWNTIDRGDIRQLWRAELRRNRALGRSGVRSAEIIVARVMALAAWLRDEKHILATACMPWKAMREDMRKDFGDYAAHQPRYTLEEYRALLAAAPQVDPRWALLLDIGAEYRLGQVRKLRRRAVQVQTMTRNVPQPNGTLLPTEVEITLVKIPGQGRKKGATVELTEDQAANLWVALREGHLAALERAYQTKTIPDYPLFGGGRMVNKQGSAITMDVRHATREPIDESQMQKWLRRNEEVARVDGQPIPHMEGRGWYGLRRAGLDAAKAEKISREGMQMSGGWSDSQVPDTIYADQEMTYARAEAAEVRARIRQGVEAPKPADGNPS